MKTIYAYPWVETMATIRQPLLVLITHDYLMEPTRRALLSAPPGTKSVDVPLEVAGEAAPTGLYSSSPAAIAGPLREFLDA